VVERVAAMAERVFGCKPLVISLPYRATLPSSSPTGFTMIVAGCNPRIANAFAAHRDFWLSQTPTRSLNANGFSVQPSTAPAPTNTGQVPNVNGFIDQPKAWQRIAPTTLLHEAGAPRFATDDWPFLYLQGRLIPSLNIRSMILLGLLGIAMVWLFLPKGQAARRIDWRMFFLGAAFMLLETKAVVQLALLFGSTWIVNSLVFFTALVMILLANLYVLRSTGKTLAWHYAGLILLLGAAIAIPLDMFLAGGVVWRYAVPCALALGPMFFAGVIFARSFRESLDPDMAFGSNIAGSVLGGISESFSMLLGFRYLLLLAIAFYLLSAWASVPRGKKASP